MKLAEVPVPEVYKESADFRLLLNWIALCLSKTQYDTDNLIDLLDPLRCPTNLLWMLGDTCGYKYDERASVAFNRLVILHFARLIRNRGSKIGVTLAAELNVDQFNLDAYAKEKAILGERLEDTSIPVNSVSVTANTKLGYLDVVYYSENIPTDICIEYVRPLGMYCFQHAGVSINPRTKISIDARLTGIPEARKKVPTTFVGHYRRADYASMQTFEDDDVSKPTPRRPVYYRNSDEEREPGMYDINPGLRSLYSLQLSNNEHIVKALMPSLEEPDRIFDVGYGPQDVNVVYPDNYLKNGEDPMYNLRINRELEESFTPSVYTVEHAEDILNPRPAVNPTMTALGDAISLNEDNTKYTKYDKDTQTIHVVEIDEEQGV